MLIFIYNNYTVYNKTFKGENFRGSSTILIMQGKLLRFTHHRLFQNVRRKIIIIILTRALNSIHWMAEEFETDGSVCRYHVYQDNWTPVVGE